MLVLNDYLQLYAYSFFIALLFSGLLISYGNILIKLTLFGLIFAFCYIVPIFEHNTIDNIVYGLFSDMSIFTMIFIGVRFLGRVFPKIRPQILIYDKWLLFIIGIVLFGSSFGFINFDLYDYGYVSSWFDFSVLIIALVLLFLGSNLPFYWLVAFVAYKLNLLAADNLWNYLYDPFVFIFAVFYLIKYYAPILYVRIKRKEQKCH